MNGQMEGWMDRQVDILLVVMFSFHMHRQSCMPELHASEIKSTVLMEQYFHL